MQKMPKTNVAAKAAAAKKDQLTKAWEKAVLAQGKCFQEQCKKEAAMSKANLQDSNKKIDKLRAQLNANKITMRTFDKSVVKFEQSAITTAINNAIAKCVKTRCDVQSAALAEALRRQINAHKRGALQ